MCSARALYAYRASGARTCEDVGRACRGRHRPCVARSGGGLRGPGWWHHQPQPQGDAGRRGRVRPAHRRAGHGVLGIDRAVEHEASLAAAAVGVGPEVMAFRESEGILVTRFIPGEIVPVERMQDPATIRRVASRCARSTPGRRCRRGSTASGSSRTTAPSPSRGVPTCRRATRPPVRRRS